MTQTSSSWLQWISDGYYSILQSDIHNFLLKETIHKNFFNESSGYSVSLSKRRWHRHHFDYSEPRMDIAPFFSLTFKMYSGDMRNCLSIYLSIGFFFFFDESSCDSAFLIKRRWHRHHYDDYSEFRMDIVPFHSLTFKIFI